MSEKPLKRSEIFFEDRAHGQLTAYFLPGAIILLATLVLRLSGPEAEWLLDSLSHLRRRLATSPVYRSRYFGARRSGPTVHPHGF
jgi:hypothetical protein